MDHSFDIQLAILLGIEEAIIIRNLQFWIAHNKANDKNLINSHTWTYNSAKAFHKLFPYMHPQKIQRILNQLIEKKILMKGYFNNKKRERTLWYAFKDEHIWISPFFKNEKCIFQNQKMDFLKIKNVYKDINNKDINNKDIFTKVNIKPEGLKLVSNDKEDSMVSINKVLPISKEFQSIILSVINPIAEQTKYINLKNKESYRLNPIDLSTTNQKHIKKINELIRYYRFLKAGRFLEIASYISEADAKKNKIPYDQIKNKKWTDEEIKTAFHNLLLEYLPGYYPSDKSTLPKHLSNLIYNQYNPECKSLFLKLFFNKPKLIDKKEVICKNEEDYQAFRRLFEDDIYGYALTDKEERELKSAINLLIDEYEEIMKTGFDCLDEKEASQNMGTSRAFFSNYLDWLEKRNEFIKEKFGNTIKICQIKPFTKTWEAFTDHIRENYGVRIYA